MKIRKRPVVVNGWRIADLLDMAKMGAGALPEPVRQAYVDGVIEFETDRITIATLEGVMTGWAGWWLIQGVKDEWYPCDEEAFDKSYDEVEIGQPSYDDLWQEVQLLRRHVQAQSVQHPTVDPYANSPEV